MKAAFVAYLVLCACLLDIAQGVAFRSRARETSRTSLLLDVNTQSKETPCPAGQYEGFSRSPLTGGGVGSAGTVIARYILITFQDGFNGQGRTQNLGGVYVYTSAGSLNIINRNMSVTSLDTFVQPANYYPDNPSLFLASNLVSDTSEGSEVWSLYHSSGESEFPWVKVDLGKEFTVHRVVLANRDDCCRSRIGGQVLMLMDAAERTTFTSERIPLKDGQAVYRDQSDRNSATVDGYLYYTFWPAYSRVPYGSDGEIGCSNCPTGCASCSSATTCTACSGSNTMMNGVCSNPACASSALDVPCATCPEGMTVSGEGAFATCVATTTTSTTTTTTTTTKTTTTTTANLCPPVANCIPTKTQCAMNNRSLCPEGSCRPGFFSPGDGSCAACPSVPNCLVPTCTSLLDSTCMPENCKEGFIGINGACSAATTRLGCFLDPRGARTLPIMASPIANTTSRNPIKECRDKCASALNNPTTYLFGLQWYFQCFCSATDNSLQLTRVPESECNTPCDTNNAVMCGGGWRNNVFRVVGGQPSNAKIDSKRRRAAETFSSFLSVTSGAIARSLNKAPEVITSADIVSWLRPQILQQLQVWEAQLVDVQVKMQSSGTLSYNATIIGVESTTTTTTTTAFRAFDLPGLKDPNSATGLENCYNDRFRLVREVGGINNKCRSCPTSTGDIGDGLTVTRITPTGCILEFKWRCTVRAPEFLGVKGGLVVAACSKTWRLPGPSVCSKCVV